MSKERAEKLMSSRSKTFDSLPPATQRLKTDFIACSAADDAPVIVFISKMMPVDRQSLPQNKPRPLTVEDLAQRRLQVRQKHAELMEKRAGLAEGGKAEESAPETPAADTASNPTNQDCGQVFIAFARVFSGTLRRGQQLYVLGPKYDPSCDKDDNVDSNLTLKVLTVF